MAVSMSHMIIYHRDDEIVYFSTNKEDCEMYIAAKNYNL